MNDILVPPTVLTDDVDTPKLPSATGTLNHYLQFPDVRNLVDFDFSEEILEGMPAPSEEVVSDAMSVIRETYTPDHPLPLVELLPEGEIAISYVGAGGHSVVFICKPDRTISVHKNRMDRYFSGILSDVGWLEERNPSTVCYLLLPVMEVTVAQQSSYIRFFSNQLDKVVDSSR